MKHPEALTALYSTCLIIGLFGILSATTQDAISMRVIYEPVGTSYNSLLLSTSMIAFLSGIIPLAKNTAGRFFTN